MSSFRVHNLRLKTLYLVCSVGIGLCGGKTNAKTLDLEAFPNPANFILRHKQTSQMVENSLHEFLLFACKEERKYWNFTADNCAISKKVREYKQKISRLVDPENKLIAINNHGAEMLKAWDLRQLIAHQFLELFDLENSEVEVNQKIWNAAIVTIAVSEAVNLLSHDIQVDFYKSQIRTQDLSRLVKQVKTICTKNLETIKSAINNLSNEIEIGEPI